MKHPSHIKVGISIGDMNGVGIELILKTFEDARVLEFCTPIVICSNKQFLFRKIALTVQDIILRLNKFNSN